MHTTPLRNHPAPPLDRKRLLLRLSSLAVIGAGGVVLLGWIFGFPLFSSLGTDTIPMAPSTALLFLLYGVGILLHASIPHGKKCWPGAALITLGAAIAMSLLVLSAQGIYLEGKHLGLPAPHPAGQPPVGHMSPVTAVGFLLAAVSFLLATLASRQRALGIAAFVCAGLLGAAGSILFLAYLFGVPLFYGGDHIPPAALTSLAFIPLGATLLALACHQPTEQQITPSRPVPWARVLVFLLLAACVVGTGILAFSNYARTHRAEAERQLSAIAEMRAKELVQYRKERQANAEILLGNASFAALVRRHLEHPEDSANSQKLEVWLSKLQEHYQYDQIRLVDTLGTIRLAAPADFTPLSAVMARRLPEILKSGKVTIQDFYRNDHNGKIYLAVLAPILDPQDGNRPLGVVALRIDPEQYLYPFLQHWAIPSKTAETLLVRREGQEVVYLNVLRFRKNTALALRFPLSKTDLPAVRAVMGQTGVIEGRDYRGMPVLADVRPIPESPWFMVNRMNTWEAYASLREGLWTMGGLVVLLLFSLGAVMVYLWQQQRLGFYRERFEAATAIKKLNRVYAVLSNINQSIVRIRDTRAMLQEACRIAVEDGEFRLAWIGLLDRTTGDVTPAATAGLDNGYVERLCISIHNELHNQGPTATTIREGRYNVANDIEHDPRMAPWRADALARGYRSSAAFPLVVFGEVRGTLSIYAGEPHFFNTTEITLLDELAHDISFALEFSEQEESRRAAEAALRETQQLFATVANTSPALIWMSGLDKGCTWFNEPWLAFTGRVLTEELGDGWTAGVHPDDLAPYLQNYTKAFEARQPFALEYRLRRHDGEYRWILDQGQPRYDATGTFTGYIGSCLDISEHRNLEKQMRHAVKMESIGTLAGGVAHDFNNILMAIIGYGQLALMGMAQDDAQRLNIEHLLEGAQRAARLTKDLLLFSRKQVSDRKPVDVNEIIKTVEKFIVRVIGEDILCETRVPDQPLSVLADSHQIEQVLINFATNARDAMPKGGTFSITVEQTILNQEFIAVHGFGKPGPYALITVSDSGCGMDEQTRLRIFEPFFTTKEVGKGTGLGLAVAYGIIKQHEGYINVYSEPDRGTIFRLYLPLVVADELAEERAEEQKAPAHGTETILMAEDDESLRAVARKTLTQFGYTVIEAADGEEAVQKFKENQADIQLLLFDIIMPKMNGQEAHEAISKIRPGVKTIFMSGYAPDMIREKAALADTASLLAKPLSPTELLRKVREILDQ